MPAPAVLFTYKRPDHTKATLDALARNALASQTDLVIFSDGAKGPADSAAVEAVREILRAATGFASVSVVEQPSNVGLAKSVIAGVTEILTRHERVIVVEDDLVTAPSFLSSMNDMLVHYQEDPLAFSVAGYSFPSSHLDIPQDYGFDTYINYRCSSWGWGTWRDRWRRIDWDMTYYPAFAESAAAQDAFNRGGLDLTEMLRQQRNGKIDSWAIRFCYAAHSNGMRCIYPVKSLVRNIGLDNSGVHSTPTPGYDHSALDEGWRPSRFCPASHVDSRIMQSFRRSVMGEPPPPSAVPADRPASVERPIRALARQARQVVRKVADQHRREDVDLLVIDTFANSCPESQAAESSFLGGQRLDARYLAPLRHSGDRAQMARLRPRVVHLHGPAASVAGIGALGSRQVPVVWTVQGRSDLVNWRAVVKATSATNLTITASSGWLADLARQGGLAAVRRLEVIPPGVDTKVFQPMDKGLARSVLGLDPGRPVLLSWAQWLHGDAGGSQWLARALASLDFPCTLLTMGDEVSGRLPLPNVSLCPLGPLKDRLSRRLAYSAADLFLCPLPDSIPPARLAEALACGAPCVAFAVEAVPEMIGHCVNGWVAGQNDVADFADGIRWIVKHSRQGALRRAARENALADHAAEEVAARYAALHAALLDGVSE